jgi:O-antigen ligase
MEAGVLAGRNADIIRKAFKNAKTKILSYTAARVTLILAISCFISVYAAAAAILLVVIRLIQTRRLIWVASMTPGIDCLWALCALGAVSALVNDNPTGIWVAALMAVFFLAGAYLRSVMTRALFDRVVKACCAASLISAAAAFVQYAIHHSATDRATSVFLNANYYAAAIEMAVLFAVYQLCKPQSRGGKAFYAVVIVLNALALHFSGCRTAVFALCAAVALTLFFQRRYKPLAIYLGLCAIAAALIFALPGVFPRMDDIGADMGTRIAIWRRAVGAIIRHPLFGEGPLAFRSFNLVLGGMHIVHSHSIYLEPLLSFGVIGAAMIGVYLKKNLSPIFMMRADKRDRNRFGLALGLLAAVALHGLVDAAAFGIQTGMLLLLALSMAGIRENPQPVPAPHPAYRVSYLKQAGRAAAAFAREDTSAATKKSA